MPKKACDACKRIVLMALLLVCLALACSAAATTNGEKMLSLMKTYLNSPAYWGSLFHAFKSMDEEETAAAYGLLQAALEEQGYWEAFTVDAGGFLHLVDQQWPLHALLKRDAEPTRPMPLEELRERFLSAPAHEKTAEAAFDVFTDAQSEEGTLFSRLTTGLRKLDEKQLKNVYANIRLLLRLQGEWDAYVAYGKMYVANKSKSVLMNLMREDPKITLILDARAYLAREGADAKTTEWIVNMIEASVSATNTGGSGMLKAMSKLEEKKLAAIFPYFRGFLLEEGQYMSFMSIASREIASIKKTSPLQAVISREMPVYGQMKIESLLAEYGEGGWSKDSADSKYSVYVRLLLDLKWLDDETLSDGYPRLREAIQANGQWRYLLQAFDEHPDVVSDGSLLQQYLIGDKQEARMRKLESATGLSFYTEDQVKHAVLVYGSALAVSPNSELSVDIGQLAALLAAMDEDEFQLIFEPIERLLTSEKQWLPFVTNCFSSKEIDQDTPLMRGMTAMRDRYCRQGGIGWTVETLQAYLGATVKDGFPLYKPENPQPNHAFLIITAENPPDVAKILREASDGGIIATHNPQEASMIVLYSEESIYAAQYGELHLTTVSAYSTEVRLTAGSLTGASPKPVKLTLRNDPPERIEVYKSQTKYYASTPVLPGTPEMAAFIEKILKWGK